MTRRRPQRKSRWVAQLQCVPYVMELSTLALVGATRDNHTEPLLMPVATA